MWIQDFKTWTYFPYAVSEYRDISLIRKTTANRVVSNSKKTYYKVFFSSHFFANLIWFAFSCHVLEKKPSSQTTKENWYRAATFFHYFFFFSATQWPKFESMQFFSKKIIFVKKGIWKNSLFFSKNHLQNHIPKMELGSN